MPKRRVLGTFELALITVAAIVSLRNLPLAAEYGVAAITLYLLAAVIFFIPISLVTAELAASLPRSGGNYVWVSEAFGTKTGFITLWISWMENIAWFPAILAFIGSTLGYVIRPFIPGLENSNVFVFSIMLIVLWGATFLNFFGIKVSSLLSSIGVILGTLIPGAFIIGLGIWWFITNQSSLEFAIQDFFPQLKLDNMVFFSGILLSFAGIELASFHVTESKNPQRDFPRALALASILIISISIMGTLSIAAVVPYEDLSLVHGLIQGFEMFFAELNITGLVPVVAALALLGSLAGVNAWIIGPVKGILVTVKDGFLPQKLHTTNKHSVPTNLLIIQAIVASILSLIFLYMKDTSTSYWILTGLSAQFTFTQYTLVFLAAVRLRFKQPDIARPFKVPGGNWGIILVSFIGILSCVTCFCLVFITPAQLDNCDANIYRYLLLTSLLFLGLPPILLAVTKKK